MHFISLAASVLLTVSLSSAHPGQTQKYPAAAQSQSANTAAASNVDATQADAAKAATKADASKVDAAKPMDPLAWLIGGVWTADASKLGPGMLRIESRYQWSDNNAFIRFTTHFVSDKGAAHTYDGNFFWNPTQKTLAVWYMNSRNGITEGPVQMAGDTMQITFRGEDFEGKLAELRVMVTRKNNHEYHWALQEMQSGAWKELASLEYLRGPGS
ncbi:MAG: hypothetical protein M3N22_00840 [Acidobacteriota bacterium]|nr:hypothetical protein [Acidobacteriota bacterium]